MLKFASETFLDAFECCGGKNPSAIPRRHHLVLDIIMTIETLTLTGIQLVADISATSPHHFLVFVITSPIFSKKSKLIVFWKAENLVDLA
jgi:hypothetical protein